MVRNDDFRREILGCFGGDEAERIVGTKFTRLLETRSGSATSRAV
jgi:hypothetical protein